MKVVGFVPIKLNSERLPNKNILPFGNGNPLIRLIQETLLNVGNIDEVYVYCSEDRIQDYLLDGVRFLKRSKWLDESSTPFNEVLLSFAKDIEADYYVLTHATSPFIKSKSIEDGIHKVKNGPYNSGVGVSRVSEFLWENDAPLNYDLTSIPRTQDLPLIYSETCGLYIYSRDLIIQEKRRIGDHPYFIELSKIESIDINDEEDFLIANAVYQLLNQKT